MHLVDSFELPVGYLARPYRGVSDLPDMCASLVAYREHVGDEEHPTLEQMTTTYTHLVGCDPELDIAVIETDEGQPAGYVRASFTDRDAGTRDCELFSPLRPEHLVSDLFDALTAGQEAHLRPRAAEAPTPARFLAFAAHPGPGQAATGEAAWLERRGYAAAEWGASLVRPHLDDIPDATLPAGVEVRPVEPHHVRAIWEAHAEAFRGEWNFHEPTDDEIDELVADPLADPTLWRVAWAGDTIVGQVKSFINEVENATRGYARGYTEYISTHHDWRGRGVARALLAMSLTALRERGMSEASLGVDTNSPGGAFHLYTSMGFELRTYGVTYARPVDLK